ncbi:MAG: hypothetical protein BJ554DRAFT_1924 [Olpidium bornovanus]|uniref:Uncharacterized protein n=1 Tax=Olpidium bornovanus TaxID=278681 RepID=A0A8H8DLV6_9FUNG|nr:MAG: hypothetical protein BJ554DRAFT_1924 [Olpidium bornovanus]
MQTGHPFDMRGAHNKTRELPLERNGQPIPKQNSPFQSAESTRQKRKSGSTGFWLRIHSENRTAVAYVSSKSP